MAFFQCVCLHMLFYKGNSLWFSTYPNSVWPYFNLTHYIYKDPISKEGPILSVRIDMNLAGDMIQPPAESISPKKASLMGARGPLPQAGHRDTDSSSCPPFVRGISWAGTMPEKTLRKRVLVGLQ